SSTQSPQEVWNHRYALKTMEFLEPSMFVFARKNKITPVNIYLYLYDEKQIAKNTINKTLMP
ncbi:hypothetical protein, partial [Acetobacter indonesiensis]|uniref:hypothetical protein n=1 Tax=Acetobacter indonesiensis TaxID=104101 RepID=UPI0039BF449C